MVAFILGIGLCYAIYYFIIKPKGQKEYASISDYWKNVMYFIVAKHPEHPEFWMIAVMHWDGPNTGDPEKDMFPVTTIPGSYCSLGSRNGTDDTTFIWNSKKEAFSYAQTQIKKHGYRTVLSETNEMGQAFEVRGRYD